MTRRSEILDEGFQICETPVPPVLARSSGDFDAFALKQSLPSDVESSISHDVMKKIFLRAHHFSLEPIRLSTSQAVIASPVLWGACLPAGRRQSLPSKARLLPLCLAVARQQQGRNDTTLLSGS